MRMTAVEKYRSKMQTDEHGKTVIAAKDILSLSWEEYAELVTMHHLPQVDHVTPEPFSSASPLSWMMKDLNMQQTVLLWLACSACLIASSVNNPHKILPALVGFASWVPIEYGYHRFIGHLPVVNDLTKKANFYLHGKHHFAPKDVDLVFLPPVLVLTVAVLLYRYVFSNITQNPELAVGFAILHYLLYDVMHYAMHKFSLKQVSELPSGGR